MAATRDRIIAATTELFRRRGYNGTTLNDVTKNAEATTGSLYHFFPGGKVELAETAITESGAAYQQLFEMIADAAADPVAATRDFFDGAADVLAECDFIDVCPIGTVAREMASADDGLRRAADRVFTSWIDAVASYFRRAGIGDPDAEELATTIVAALEGAFVLARCRRDAGILRLTGRRMQELVAAHLVELPTPRAT
jgi:AcrR family transcriptional regulator